MAPNFNDFIRRHAAHRRPEGAVKATDLVFSLWVAQGHKCDEPCQVLSCVCRRGAVPDVWPNQRVMAFYFCHYLLRSEWVDVVGGRMRVKTLLAGNIRDRSSKRRNSLNGVGPNGISILTPTSEVKLRDIVLSAIDLHANVGNSDSNTLSKRQTITASLGSDIRSLISISGPIRNAVLREWRLGRPDRAYHTPSARGAAFAWLW